MVLATIGEKIIDVVTALFNPLFLAIDSMVYSAISLLYQKFLVLASLRVISDSMYQTFADGVYTIIGVLALFLLAYELLKSMIDPDVKKTATDIKKIIQKTITSIILILLVPTIFQFMFGLQNSILSNNVIGKLANPVDINADFNNNSLLTDCLDVSRQSSLEDDESDVKLRCYGNMASVLMFQGFFHPNLESEYFQSIKYDMTSNNYTDMLNEASNNITSVNFPAGLGDLLKSVVNPFHIIDVFKNIIDAINSDTLKISLTDAYNIAIVRGDFSFFSCFTDDIFLGRITYTWGLSTLAGIFAAYVLFLYCLDVAIRAIKLGFYQIIAPIPIMTRITKKDEVFKNWLKCVGSCYFEVFTRMAILYFGMFLISNVFSLMGNALSSGSVAYNILGGGTSKFDVFGKLGLWLFVKANIILAIFGFMKKAPDLLKQIFPSSDKFSLKLWDHLKDSFAIPAAVGGFVGGTIASGGNPLSGIRAAGKGWKDSSLTGIGAERKKHLAKLEADRQSRAAGQSTGERIKQRMLERGRGFIGLDSGVDELNRKIDRGEGLKPGTRIIAVNDSMDDIQLLDSESHNIGTVNRGETRVYDKETKTNAETSLEMWKRRQSDIKEIANKYDETASGMRTVASSAKAFDDVMESKLLKGDSKYTLQYSMFKDNQGKYHVVYGVDESDFKNNLRAKLDELGYADGAQKDALIESISNSSSLGNLSTFQNYTAGFLRKHDGEEDLGNSYDEINQSGTKAMDALKKLAEKELILGQDDGSGRMIKAGQGSLNTLINNIVAGKLLELQATRDADGTITGATLDRLRNIQVGSYTLDLTAPGFATRLQDALRAGQFTADELISSLKNLETAATNVETEKTSDAGKLTQRLNEADSQVKAHTRFIETGNKAVDIEKRSNTYTAQQATTEYINKTKGGNS